MVNIAVFDGVFDAAALDKLAVFEVLGTGGVEVFEVFEGVFIDENQVGEVAFFDAAELVFHAEDFGVGFGGVLDDVDGVEAGFLH